ncbi:MAG: ABC transporter substrate-binding protein, partial [Oscillospiraceae bacterium]|nr:ABC transporter substrate-binding protein [Oscillospiraceae bacterium]
MKKSFIALLAAALLLSACGNTDTDITEEIDSFEEEPEEIIPKNDIIIGTTGMTGSFSPFYSVSAGDADVMSVINVPLVTLDRRGEVVRNAAVGEWRIYNGTEYYYEGIADTIINITENNTTVLTFRLREDVFFSDGVNMTADDVIFTLNTLINSQQSAVSALPVAGLANYRANAVPEVYEKYAEIVAEGGFTEEQAELYRECERQAWLTHIEAIIDYCVQNYGGSAHIIAEGDINEESWLQVALAMMVWRIADFPVLGEDSYGNFTSVSNRVWDFVYTFPTPGCLFEEFYLLYDGDLEAYIRAEKIGQPWLDNVQERAELLFIREMAASDEENSAVNFISGIRRVSDYIAEVTLEGHIPAAVYAFTFPVVPVHYYLDSAHRQFMPGAGPYKLTGFENGVAALEANEFYFKGTPGVSEIFFAETDVNDLVYGVAAGEIDIAAVVAERDVLGEIYAYSEAEIKTQEADYGAFGFIGFNAERVNDGEDPLSEASINLRKGIAVVFAAYRDISVGNFYEGAARVAEYPVSGVSWAAPRTGDNGFRTAFNTDVTGELIYDFDISEARRLEAARRAALGYFQAAGCALNAAGTAIIELPEEMSGNYEVYVVGFGTGRHPSFLLLTMAADTLRTVGINIDIIDVSSQAEMYEAVFSGEADMWCAAWQGDILPNMSKVFRSGGEENFFRLSDEMIDQRIDLAKTSLNLEFYRG